MNYKIKLPSKIAKELLEGFSPEKTKGIEILRSKEQKDTTSIEFAFEMIEGVDRAECALSYRDNLESEIKAATSRAFQVQKEKQEADRPDFVINIRLATYPIEVLNSIAKRFVKTGQGEERKYPHPFLHLRRVEANGRTSRSGIISPMQVGKLKKDAVVTFVFDMTTHKSKSTTVAFHLGQVLEEELTRSNRTYNIEQYQDILAKAVSILSNSEKQTLVDGFYVATGDELIRLGKYETRWIDSVTGEMLKPKTGTKTEKIKAKLVSSLFASSFQQVKLYQGRQIKETKTYIVPSESGNVIVHSRNIQEQMNLAYQYGEGEFFGAGLYYANHMLYQIAKQNEIKD